METIPIKWILIVVELKRQIFVTISVDIQLREVEMAVVFSIYLHFVNDQKSEWENLLKYFKPDTNCLSFH